MVGTIGTMEGISAQLSLAASHGNIDIDVQQAKSPYPRKAPQAADLPKGGRHPRPSLPVENPAAGEPVQSQDQPIAETNNSAPETIQPEADPRLAILQALRDGADQRRGS